MTMLNTSMLKSIETTLSRVVKYNDLDTDKNEFVILFYLFSSYKALDLIKGIKILESKKNYRNILILSRTLLDLNFRFLYLDKEGTNAINNFIGKTGTKNVENRIFDGFVDFLEQRNPELKEFKDLEIKGNAFRSLDQIAINLGKEKYYDYFYSLYSRFAHTNSLVINSYLNDLEPFYKKYKYEAGNHFKNNKQYLVLSNIFFHEIIEKSMNYFVENGYMPSEDYLHKNFLLNLKKEKEYWEDLNKKMESVSFPY